MSPSRAELEAVKTVALACGVRLTTETLTRLGGHDALTVHEYATTGGITLELPHDVLVNAPFDEAFCADSPLALETSDDGLTLELGDTVVPVRSVLPLPGYLDATAADGNLASATVMSHADRLRVSPIEGCAYDCHFCDLGTLRYVTRPAAQINAAIDVALQDEALPARHLLISGGSPSRAPAQQAYFEQTCLEIVRHVRQRTAGRTEPFEVDIMMTPKADGPAFVERMVEAGVTSFSFNVEVYSERGAREHLPLKHKLSRAFFEPTIARAVELLGRESGHVRSLIIPGLETERETLEGIEWLAEMGVHPVLSPFRPALGTRLEQAAPVDPVLLTHVLEASREIVARHGVALGPHCVPCQHNTLTFPWDGSVMV
jgi:hypothetical protein